MIYEMSGSHSKFKKPWNASVTFYKNCFATFCMKNLQQVLPWKSLFSWRTFSHLSQCWLRATRCKFKAQGRRAFTISGSKALASALFCYKDVVTLLRAPQPKSTHIGAASNRSQVRKSTSYSSRCKSLLPSAAAVSFKSHNSEMIIFSICHRITFSFSVHVESCVKLVPLTIMQSFFDNCPWWENVKM